MFLSLVFHKMVWFHLVNKEGQAYQGSTPTSLSISQGTNVDGFRKEVKKECPQIPPSIGASQLKVYKNVAALLGEEEVLPLDEEANIGELKIGQSKKEALAVVVPAETSGFLLSRNILTKN